MRPLAVLILVLGAASALLFAFLSISGSEGRKNVIAGPEVLPAEIDRPRPTDVVDLVDEPPSEAATALEPERTVVAGEGGGSYQNSLGGIVVDKHGNPIEGAVVQLGPSDAMSEIGDIARIMADAPEEGPSKTFKTTKSGEFRFRYLEPGSWGLVVAHPNFARKRIANILVDEASQITETIKLAEGFSLSGYVRDKGTGLPIEGATLQLDQAMAVMLRRPSASKRQTRTGPDGSYSFPNIARENLAIVCSAEGYGTQIHQNLALSLTPATEDTGAASTEGTERNFELEIGKVIAGRVIAPDQTPIQGATVEALRHDTNYTSRGMATSREDGEFVIEGLAEGTYTLRPKLPAGWEADPLLQVEAGTTDVLIQAFEQGAVNGRVVDAKTGKPLNSFALKVRLVHPTTQSYGSIVKQHRVKNSEKGEFELAGISENTYVVQADSRGYASSFSEPFQVVQGMEAAEVVVRMTQGGTLRGLILDSYSGKPVAGAKVSTHENRWIDSEFTKLLGGIGQSALSSETTKTNEKGEFEFKLLTPGTYQIRIQHNTYTRQVHDEIRVVDGSELEIGPYLLAKGAMLTGTVYGSDGAPGAGMRVFLRPLNGDVSGGGQARTDANGMYTIKNVAAGNYKLSASRAQEDMTGSPFDTILDMKNSEVEISLQDGNEYSHDLRISSD